MSKPRPKKQKQAKAARERKLWPIAIATLLVMVAALLLLFSKNRRAPRNDEAAYQPRAAGQITFSKDIAPIIFENCSSCHRPGQSAPFALLSFADVKKHARDIADVTARRYMPPWLPQESPGLFEDERRLTPKQIGLIQQWVAEGAQEGRSQDQPPTPQFSSDWQLGEPDLVVSMPEAYMLPAEGRDVYRNFVLPASLTRSRFIRALEFRPGSKVIHHAFVRYDRTGGCRELDAKEPGPGFGGMDIVPFVETPLGHFSGWVPGARPIVSQRGLAWQLPAGADIIVLMHMQPSGKPEPVTARVGIYFTDEAPTNIPAVVNLQSYAIDIPAGVSNYVVEERLTLPVATDLLAVKPHVHYVGRRLEGFAALPDGSSRSLLVIPEWDFNWQTDYRYAKPISLPAGTTLRFRYTYDNSTNNARNPHRPPARVKYGVQTTDEMAELAFQMLPRKEDWPRLQAALADYTNAKGDELNRRRYEQNPNDPEAAAEMAKLLFRERKLDDAERLLRQAVQLQPGSADIRYSLGVLLMEKTQLEPAEREFLEAIRIDPGHFKARNNAGLCFMQQGKLLEAEAQFREVLRLRPGDTIAQGNLNLVLQARGAK